MTRADSVSSHASLIQFVSLKSGVYKESDNPTSSSVALPNLSFFSGAHLNKTQDEINVFIVNVMPVFAGAGSTDVSARIAFLAPSDETLQTFVLDEMTTNSLSSRISREYVDHSFVDNWLADLLQKVQNQVLRYPGRTRIFENFWKPVRVLV